MSMIEVPSYHCGDLNTSALHTTLLCCMFLTLHDRKIVANGSVCRDPAWAELTYDFRAERYRSRI